MHWFLKLIFGIKLYMFRTVPLSIIRSFSLYTQQWYMSYRFADSLRAGSGRNSVLILLARCQQICMTFSTDLRHDPACKLSANLYDIQHGTPSWSCSQAVSKPVWHSARNSVMILLASCQHNMHDIYHCCVYSEKLLMMDRGTVRNM